MVMKQISIYSLAALMLLGILSSCSKNKSGQSSKTGMAYNSKYNCGFEVNNKVKPGRCTGLIAI